MKKVLLLLSLVSFFMIAQLHAQKVSYTVHTVASGETLSALAEKFHTTVGDIMRLNGMTPQSQLKTGAKIKIPAPGVKVVRASDGQPVAVTASSTSSAAPKSAATTATTHVVIHGETLYSISKKYGIKTDQLKQWNKITNNNIETGQELAVSAAGVEVLAAKAAAQPKTDTVVNQAVNTTTTSTENKTEIPDTSKQLVAKSVDVDVVPVNPKILTSTDSVITTESKENSGSYFGKDFMQSSSGVKTISGNAMAFKTVSGWNDKKYYILMNELPVGNIVKVTAANGNSVYAKVLWKLEDMKLNQGLNFRISDAAAAALGINDSKFNLTVFYHE